jgi:uncharacterized protein (TIGR04551 family)
MFRPAAALAAFALVPALALAQAQPQPAPQPDKEKKVEELDPKTKAAIDRAVEKAKEDLRNEVRAEMQGAQSAAEFMGAVAEGPKLEFFEANGYLRVRGMMLGNPSLGLGADPSGRYPFPMPFDRGSDTRQGYSTANMRFRFEPTLNVSEHVRIRAQLDFLDNFVLGSSPSTIFFEPNGQYPAVWYGNNRVVSNGNDPRLNTPYVSPKRVWGEVQTPVGLLSFGRMPSAWGLGIMANAGTGLDDDFGDSVDRIQFALPPVSTPVGRLAFVPIVDFDYEGVLYKQPWAASGTGQPFSAQSGDDGKGYGLKVVRLDTPDEVRRKHERNEASVNFGAYYTYRVEREYFPLWDEAGFDAKYTSTTGKVERGGYANVLDLWFRYLSSAWRVEVELSGNYGQIGDARSDPILQPQPFPKTFLRQWGGVAVAEYKVLPNKLTLSGEIGVASGDPAPGFGNVPGYGPSPYGSYEGAQICPPAFVSSSGLPGTCPRVDTDIRNFRFNPAYRVDLILWSQIIGGVTDAFYLKPKLHWDIVSGLGLDFWLVYSRAMEKGSTWSVRPDGSGGDANLGIEADGILTYTSADGFVIWAQGGVLSPLHGLDSPTRTTGRATLLASGLAIKF